VQGLFLHAKVLKCENSHEEAIKQFMNIISMVPQQPEYVRVVANEVVHIASTLCNFSEDLKSRILGVYACSLSLTLSSVL
jgi:NADH:ubiquinone oxidoreductase subunit D